MSEDSKTTGDLNTYWEALYAIRCIAEHTGGRKSKARHMREEIETIRKIADNAIQEVKGSGR